jgi:hypothetical protein
MKKRIPILAVMVFAMFVTAYLTNRDYRGAAGLMAIGALCMALNFILKRRSPRPEQEIPIILVREDDKGVIPRVDRNWKPPGCITRRGGLGHKYIKD